jgi:adenylate cyclase class 2
MVEVEMKFPVADFAALERRLGEQATRQETVGRETDCYFKATDRDFAQTDEALRLRRIGTANFVTYKGPKRDTQTKTRTEVEVPLGPGDAVAADFTQLLGHLGYRPVATVTKERRIYHLRREGFALEVCLDDVASVGRYAELEIAATEEQLDAARRVLQQTAVELGLTGSERRSYLELLLSRQAGHKNDAGEQ